MAPVKYDFDPNVVRAKKGSDRRSGVIEKMRAPAQAQCKEGGSPASFWEMCGHPGGRYGGCPRQTETASLSFGNQE